MDKPTRRQMVRDYREQKIDAGVFAVRCAATGEVWVGGSRNIDKQQNGVWFGLRTGGHANRQMQAAWTAHGEASFAFEVLERIETEEMTPLGLSDHIKSREQHWRETLGARRAAG
ncbi:MAG: GIY-YIG nuclease family protein [Phenylobacterium sp.]|uniref:GIY-YIG nuclease family protein n=1 Tax=Phenylobacterium sp. TaxID=1871053 RepID=UPI0025D97733|nr:GIY-YIG nuclease family protein [Phenylobacterium sp.]MBI1198388.1 GIY-YIG nuclease family protein [Phenylobacterium sp.]